MSQEPMTPDVVELVRGAFEAVNRGDLDTVMSLFAPVAVVDLSQRELPSFEGVSAIRSFLEDWIHSYEELRWELEEVMDLGDGVVFGVVHQNARPTGSAGYVRQREGWVWVWVEGLIVRMATYSDIDEARAAAERLAHERAQADA
jgi:ketosteroid isomerase-like protein